jgi:hypothetical protein
MTGYSWIRAIVEDPDYPGELLLDLGDELCEHLGWKEGDELEWNDNQDGSWSLKKKSRDDS